MRTVLWIALVLFFSFAQADEYIPSIESGKKIYQESCIACHGSRGDADTATARALVEKSAKAPRSFADPKVQETLTPTIAFDAITNGREGSEMKSFAHLSVEQRWDIAAYLFTLRSDLAPLPDPRPEITWSESKSMSDLDVIEMFRRRGVPEDQIIQQLSMIRQYPE